ncbi:hypothetical protein [Spirosoma pulveris]
MIFTRVQNSPETTKGPALPTSTDLERGIPGLSVEAVRAKAQEGSPPSVGP